MTIKVWANPEVTGPAAPHRPAQPLTAPVPSPCIDVCRMGADSGLCEGCLRTLDEIAAWSQLSDAAKSEVWAALAQRRQVRTASAAVVGAAPTAGDAGP